MGHRTRARASAIVTVSMSLLWIPEALSPAAIRRAVNKRLVLIAKRNLFPPLAQCLARRRPECGLATIRRAKPKIGWRFKWISSGPVSDVGRPLNRSVTYYTLPARKEPRFHKMNLFLQKEARGEARAFSRDS